jgi:hypothetical protein
MPFGPFIEEREYARFPSVHVGVSKPILRFRLHRRGENLKAHDLEQLAFQCVLPGKAQTTPR